MEIHWNLIMHAITALGIGLLIGLEREYGQRKIEGHSKRIEAAGIRTFAMVALLGNFMTWLPEPLNLWMPAIGISFVVLIAILSYQRTSHHDKGFTSEAALVTTCILGTLTGFDLALPASMVAIVMVGLLHFKKWLHHFSHSLSDIDIRQALLFLVLTVIILPILPNQTFGPYDAFNPYRIWMMVVLISGLGFAAYAAIKILGSRSGLMVTGLLGGLVSSTATTLAMSRLSQKSPELQNSATLATLLACTTMFPRVLLLTLLFNPALTWNLIPSMLIITLYSISISAYLWHQSRLQQKDSQQLYQPQKNPLSLRIALVFALFYALIVLSSHIALAHFGQQGLLTLAGLSGLSDVDAITLSLIEISQQGVSTHLAAQGIMLACAANSLVKLSIGLSISPKSTYPWLIAGLLPMVLFSLASLYFI